MNERELQLECRALAVGYDGKSVLENIDFEVHSGDYLCIIGSNGAGKTTLMKTLLGILPPVAGQIRTADGLSLKGIGYLPQQAEMQRDFPASVLEVVVSGFHYSMGLRPFYSKAERSLASENLRRLGLEGFERRPYCRLSGGQQQRVLLARALCAANGMLILDEPVAGLDPEATRTMYSLIQQLNLEGMTIMMISHDLEAVTDYASHVLKLGGGNFFGTRQEFSNYTGGTDA